MTDYESGQWRSLNRVLALINTYDENTISRKRLYRDIIEMRPETITERNVADALMVDDKYLHETY